MLYTKAIDSEMNMYEQKLLPDHRNIVKYYEHYKDDDYYYAILEYIKGDDLQTKLEQNRGYFSEF